MTLTFGEMTCAVQVDPEGREVRKKLTGVARGADLLECIEYGRTHLPPEVKERALVDLNDVTLELARHELLGISAELGRDGCGNATAVVAETDLTFGIARQLASLSEEIHPMRVFRTSAEAEEWLAGFRPASV